MNSPSTLAPLREQMNIVIVGHVDHGKSTLVGRILADTESIDPNKIKQVREICERQGKRFEYAFLLDALEAERDQGITIDAARCFFRSERRDYIIIDAPGHIEFLKNMISGAARAEAAVLLIDADEGVQENSRRHGYMLSLLGIKQVVVAVNKMDLVDYDRSVFDGIVDEYTAFLGEIGIEPAAFIPISALAGDNITSPSNRMPWFDGPATLTAIDRFEKAPPPEDRPLRLPVQDVYKFNRQGDTRRIIAGRVTSGAFSVGDTVLFVPSNKRTRVASIEGFNLPEQHTAVAGQSTGLTTTEQIYVGRGEVMCHPDSAPQISNRVRANVFWLGRRPLRMGRSYKLKMATYSGLCEVEHIVEVIDASALSGAGHVDRVERHEVAEVVLKLRKPMACDLSHTLADTSRFVLVDAYDMAGGGIVRSVLDADDSHGDSQWTQFSGTTTRPLREAKNGHRAALVIIHDDHQNNGQALAAAFEESLWAGGRAVFHLDLSAENLQHAGPSELHLRSISFARVTALLAAGQVVVATVPFADHHTHDVQLVLPGLELTPMAQVRFRDDVAELGATDWIVDRREQTRAQHNQLKGRLDTLLQA